MVILNGSYCLTMIISFFNDLFYFPFNEPILSLSFLGLTSHLHPPAKYFCQLPFIFSLVRWSCPEKSHTCDETRTVLATETLPPWTMPQPNCMSPCEDAGFSQLDTSLPGIQYCGLHCYTKTYWFNMKSRPGSLHKARALIKY